MPFSSSIHDRERDKFVETTDNETAVRVLLAEIADGVNLLVRPSGLSTELKITTLNVTDTAAKIPATPLADRNAISIHNLSTSTKIYIGNSDVTADAVLGTTAGWELDPDSYQNFDITDNIEIYAVAEAGKTVKIKVMEIA